MNEATFSISLLRNSLQYAEAKYGLNPEILCKEIGIDIKLLENPDHRVSGEFNRAMWRELIKQTGDIDIGLHMGEVFNPSAIGILGYVLFNCQTLREVFDKLSRYMSLSCEGISISFSVEENLVVWNCDVSQHYKNYLLEELRHPIESTFAAVTSTIKILTGKALCFSKVSFQHPEPENTSEHKRIFKAPILFSQFQNHLVFNAECLEWKILSSNPNLLASFENQAESMMNKLNYQNDLSICKSLSAQVGFIIKKNITGRTPSLSEVAQHLFMSERNLQRALKAEKTSYQKVLDQTRKELAISYLKRNNSIEDIAFLLGFSESSAFHRSFKKWTGETPGNYRLQINPNI